VLKDDDKDDVLGAIRAVGRGGAFFGPGIAARLADFLTASRPDVPKEAPFPNKESKAGAYAFPGMVPLTPHGPGAAAGREVAEALVTDARPTLLLWADSDPMLPLEPFGRMALEHFPPRGK